MQIHFQDDATDNANALAEALAEISAAGLPAPLRIDGETDIEFLVRIAPEVNQAQAIQKNKRNLLIAGVVVLVLFLVMRKKG